MAKDWVDFRAVKEAVGIERVLAHYGVKLRKVNKYQLRGKCPLPTHTSQESSKAGRESFGVNTRKNVWACQSQSCKAARGGRAGGNVLDLCRVMEGGISVRDAALKLADWFNVEATERRPTATAGAAESEELVAGREVASDNQHKKDVANKPLCFTLRGVDPSHPYLSRRGIKKETAAYFGVGFFPGKGSMRGRVVIPIHNEKGELIAYAGRAIDDSEPKYKLPAGFKKSLVLYNLHRALKVARGGCVVVVEGFFDCMKVEQAFGLGQVLCVGLMGISLSDAQRELLITHFDRGVVVLLDGDEPGREAAAVIAEQLIPKVFVRVVTLADGQQPDRLSSEQLRDILSFLL